MKKILFVVPHMICGGVEKALLALIHELAKGEDSISVRVVKSEGDFVSLIPDYICLLYTSFTWSPLGL